MACYEPADGSTVASCCHGDVCEVNVRGVLPKVTRRDTEIVLAIDRDEVV